MPFVPLEVRTSGNDVVLGFDSLSGVNYAVETRTTITGTGTGTTGATVTGTGNRMEVPLPITGGTQFFQLVARP